MRCCEDVSICSGYGGVVVGCLTLRNAEEEDGTSPLTCAIFSVLLDAKSASECGIKMVDNCEE